MPSHSTVRTRNDIWAEKFAIIDVQKNFKERREWETRQEMEAIRDPQIYFRYTK